MQLFWLEMKYSDRPEPFSSRKPDRDASRSNQPFSVIRKSQP